MSLLSTLALSAGIGLAVMATLALGLIASQRPDPDPRGEGLDFGALTPAQPAPLHPFTARDGAELGYRRWEAGVQGVPLVVMVHGSGWHGAQFQGLGAALAGLGLADVVAPDLRGHGPSPQRRGDVDYIGQFEDDLADLIAAQARPGQAVVMLGHSSGGGLVVRFAGGEHGGLLAGAVLLAPFLQHDAPTTRPHSGGWARVLLRRMIGLSLLNAARITALNHLTVIQFLFPDAVLNGPQGHTATRSYSYRLNTGFAPRRDWRADVAALPRFLLVVGRRDEAFVADAFEPTLSAITPRGTYRRIESGHLGVVDAPETLAALSAFLSGLAEGAPAR